MSIGGFILKKIRIIFLAFCLFISSSSISLGSGNIVSRNNDEIHDEIKIIINKIENNYDIPEVSGEIVHFPWRNDSRFLEAKEKYNTQFLLAGFCAVLKDPLPGEEFNVKLASESVSGHVIKPSKTFSQNSIIGPYTKYKGYKEGASYIGGNIVMTEGGGVCKIATVLYNLAVLSDLEILERHNHSMPINYVPYGQDATVAYGVKDFKFKNTTEGNILIWSRLIGNRLYMAFYGNQPSPSVSWHHEIQNVIEPSTKYIKNEDLKPGEMKTIIKGLEGATVKSTITIKYGDGTTIIKNMGISKYAPLPELIEIN